MKAEGLPCVRSENGSAILAVIFWIWLCCSPSAAPAGAADNPNPPSSPIKLIFIHHSTGGNWLADANESGPYGMLGNELMKNNYYVSATNYGWGPDGIGDRTDIVNWPEWFTGGNQAAILTALFAETGQNIQGYGDWTRLETDPGGENQIVLFKSCFPNSDLYGNPTDNAYSEPNDWEFSVSNAKAVYNSLLTTFAAHQDKLFVVITAPPLAQNEYARDQYQSPASRAANARAFNNWLVQDWLTGYPYNNVAVFDYYNVLTSNGSNADVSDVNQTSGNHHRWWNGSVQHIQQVDNNYASYPTGDSHPSSAGQQKATSEFVPLLNVFYHRWKTETPAKPDVDCIFDWVVREYPAYFQPASAATTWSGEELAFRYFSGSLAYLAAYFGTMPEYADNLLYLGPLTDNTIAKLGAIDTWAGICNCQGLSEDLPKAATLVSPSGTSGSSPSFLWNAVPNATSYYLWVNDSSEARIKTWYTATQAGCTSGTGTCTITPGTSLSDGLYTWWIQTANEFGSGAWSKGMSFSVISFEVDPGYRINFASNPRIIDYQNGQLALGYEYQAKELADSPSERGYVAFSTDGLTFYGHRQFQPGESKGKGVLVDATTWRRYFEDQTTGLVLSESSVDGVNYVLDDGYRYDLNTYDNGNMGVYTYFVDKFGGVVLLYNSNTMINGEEVILIKRAYSKPGDKGLNFVLTDEDVIGMTYADGMIQSFADPNAIVLPDGRVRLIVMQQDRNQPKPPLGRTGTIYSFISTDGDAFEFEAKLFAWDSFTDLEVRSLNDPKIVGFDDGTYHIYVAAMVPVEPGEEDQGSYKWVLN